jgi:hypothetical protein
VTSNLPPGARRDAQQYQGSTQTRTAEEAFSRLWDILRDDDVSELDNICTDDFRLTMPGAANVSLDEAKQIFQVWRTAFRDFGQRRGNLTTIMSEDGQQAAIRDSHTITHTGDFQLPNGQAIEASGRDVVIYGAYFILTDEDGRIKKLDIYYSTDDLAAQMLGENR